MASHDSMPTPKGHLAIVSLSYNMVTVQEVDNGVGISLKRGGENNHFVPQADVPQEHVYMWSLLDVPLHPGAPTSSVTA